MELGLIPGYPEGSDLTILNTMYIGRRKDEKGKVQKDFIMILYRDNITGEKKYHTIYEPEYGFYRIEDQWYPNHNLLFVEKEKCDYVQVKYADLTKEIAKLTGNMDFYYGNISNGNAWQNERLHTIQDIMFSDMNIEDYYRFLFSLHYVNNSFKLNKAFADIEVDGKYQSGDFPEMGECPVNAISMIDERSNTIFTFLLRDKNNPLIEKFEQSLNQSFFDKLKQFVVEKVGGYKQATRYGLLDIEYKLFFFDREEELISTFFAFIHLLKADFLEFWNMAFDLEYLICRQEALGMNPLEVMCDPSIKEKVVRFYIDERNKNDFAERCDFANISMYTVLIDQMIQFASRRKSGSKISSYKLDDIGKRIAKVQKLSYSHITNKIAELPYLDYETFVMYNIFDTIVQKCIETKTNDLEYTFNKSLANNTRYQKVHRQSVYLINRFTKEFYKDGFIIGNNINRWNPRPDVKFPGALVGDPTHNSNYAKEIINGRASMIARNLMDYDYKSLYPSITIENNIAPNTQIGKIIMNQKIYDNENAYHKPDIDYSRAGEYLDNLMSGNIVEFCKRYFHVGGYLDVVHDMYEFFDLPNHTPTAPIDWFVDGKSRGIYESPEAGGKHEAFTITDDWKQKAVNNFSNYKYGYDELLEDIKKVVRL